MQSDSYAALAALAEQRWGLVTTAQATRAGVSRVQLSRLASSGGLIRVAQGVYRIAGAPELEREPIYATWLALGGATREPTSDRVAAVVAAGITAAELHDIGDFWPEGHDFVVPRRRGTRLSGVRLRVRHLSLSEVRPVDGVPTLTVERTIADLVEQCTDRSLVADALGDAVSQGKLISRDRLASYLAPLAATNGYPARDGESLAAELHELAGAESGNLRG